MNESQILNQGCILTLYGKSQLCSKIGILFFHGSPGSGAHALMQLAPFQELEKWQQCFYFDQRGSGKSEYDLRNGLTIEQITTDVFAVVEVMKNNGIQKNCGSLGGSF